MKSPIKSLLTISSFVLTLLSLTTIANAQVIHSESFDGPPFPPVGWVNSGINSLWVQRMNGTFPTCTPHSGAAMARYSARNQPAGTQEVFVSPVVDFSGNINGATPTFSLWVYRNGGITAGDSVTIFVNTTNSLTGATRIGAVARSRFFLLPVNELTDGWYQYTFNVPSTANADTNYFLLNGTSLDGENIYIDDISWVEYPEMCSGTPVAGNITSSTTVICGGPGSADLTLNGASSNFSGLSYHWQSAPDSAGPWTDFGTGLMNENTGTLSAPTYFRCYVECSASGLSDTTAFLFIDVHTTLPPAVSINQQPNINYCTGYAPIVVVASGANTYTWNPDISINNGVGDSALAAPGITTTYAVTGTDSVGCFSTVTFTVNVHNTPNVNATTSQDTICEGETTNLQSFVTGPGMGISYMWNPGNIAGQNVNASPTVTTTYIVSATSVQWGCVGNDSVVITVIPAPVVAFSFTAVNQIVTFTDNSVGAVSWMWDFGDGVTSNQQHPIHLFGAIGTYTVTLTISDGTCTNTISQLVTITQVGLPQLSDEAGFLMFPNPADASTTIEFVSHDDNVILEITNASGQLVFKESLFPVEGLHYKTQIQTDKFSNGVYLLKLTSGENQVNKKLTVY